MIPWVPEVFSHGPMILRFSCHAGQTKTSPKPETGTKITRLKDLIHGCRFYHRKTLVHKILDNVNFEHRQQRSFSRNKLTKILVSLGEILMQATIHEESLSEATNCDPMPPSSNESEKPSCSSSNTAFKKSPQTSKGPSQSSCDKERETIMLNNTFPDVDLHKQNLCGIQHTCELVYSVKSPTEKVSKFQHSMLSRPEAYDPETGI